MLIAFIAALLDVTIGVAYGLVSGLLGGCLLYTSRCVFRIALRDTN
ncbi:hypothetical protein [Enterococcus faecium]|nr:hypothetical protein [Enterococcus faecium]